MLHQAKRHQLYYEGAENLKLEMDRCKPEVPGRPRRKGETRVGRVEVGQGRTGGIGQTQKGGKCSAERAAVETDSTHIR